MTGTEMVINHPQISISYKKDSHWPKKAEKMCEKMTILVNKTAKDGLAVIYAQNKCRL